LWQVYLTYSVVLWVWSSTPNVGLISVAQKFPSFSLNNEPLQFVQEFKGHILSNTQLDDADIARERKNLFYRCNVLIRRFYDCSVAVKQRLFKSFCLCFYDVALWSNFTAFSYNKLKSAYVKCCKIFFGYNKYYSVTVMNLIYLILTLWSGRTMSEENVLNEMS